MNCTSFRTFAGAFADGELDVRQNLEALEHINMCPSCAGRVEEISRQRSAIVRLWGDHSAPPRVHREVHSLLQREAGTAVLEDEWDEFDVETQYALSLTGTRSRRRGGFVLLGLAFAFASVFALWPGSGGPSSASAQFVNAVREHHLDCRLWRGGDYLDMNQVAALQTAARQNFSLSLAVPRLNNLNYRLRSGCQCDLKGVQGMHLTYVVPESGERLSIFTTPPRPELVPQPKDELLSRQYYLSADNESPAVIAWHDERRTVTVCAGMAPGALVHMFDQVLMVLDRQHPEAGTVLLASAGQ